MNRTPFVVMAVLAALLLGLTALGGGEEKAAPAAAKAPETASIPVIAKRVADIRGLEFTTVPEPVTVTPDKAKEEGLEDLDRSYPAADQRADEEILKLLGLIDPKVRLRDISAETFSQGVAGYYDPRSKRLRIVKGTATGSRVMAEMVLSHELTHALEDQRFELKLGEGGSDDRALARLAMVEGTASWLMQRYVEEHFTAEETLGGTLAAAFADTGSLPAFLQAQLVFPYTGGQAFIEALRERAGDRWELVDLAERSRPPVSTEQVMHPDKYVRAEAPQRVRLDVKLPGFERVRSGTMGEFQTREMLAAAGGGGSSDAAAGLGRGPLRAVAATGRGRLRGAVPRPERARGALGVGHAARRGGVRAQAPPVGVGLARGPAGHGDRPAGRRGHARAGARRRAGPARRGFPLNPSSRGGGRPIPRTCAPCSAVSPAPAPIAATTPSRAATAAPTWARAAPARARSCGCSAAPSSGAWRCSR